MKQHSLKSAAIQPDDIFRLWTRFFGSIFYNIVLNDVIKRYARQDNRFLAAKHAM